MIALIFLLIALGYCFMFTYIVCVDNNYPEWKAFVCALIFPIFWLIFLLYFGCITKDLWK